MRKVLGNIVMLALAILVPLVLGYAFVLAKLLDIRSNISVFFGYRYKLDSCSFQRYITLVLFMS